MRRSRQVALLPGLLVAAIAGGATGAASAAPDASAYCDAHLAAESAFNSEDPDAIEAAVEELFAAAPDDLLPTVQTMIENAPEFGPPEPDFIAAYNEVAGWVRDNCGFADLQVLAQDYSFSGLPADVAAGPAVIELVNDGTEVHEILLLKRAEGFDAPLEELLAMLAEEGEDEEGGEGTGPPEGEMGEEPISFAGVAYAFPGESGFGVFDLAPGNYIAICFVPVGTTPEVFEAMMAEMAEGSGPPMEEGPPHFTEGMIQEFTVT